MRPAELRLRGMRPAGVCLVGSALVALGWVWLRPPREAAAAHVRLVAEGDQLPERILDAAAYAAQPSYNPRLIELDPHQFLALEALVESSGAEVRLATAEMHHHASEWARIRIQLGHFERIDTESGPSSAAAHRDPAVRGTLASSGRAPDGGAIVYVSSTAGHSRVVVFPGEYAPYDVAVADKHAVVQDCNRRVAAFFASL